MKKNTDTQKAKTLPGWSPVQHAITEIEADQAWDNIRKQIRHRIRELGYESLDSFAQECGMHRGSLSRILNNKRDVQFSTLWRIIKALGYSDIPSASQLPDPLPSDWDDL